MRFKTGIAMFVLILAVVSVPPIHAAEQARSDQASIYRDTFIDGSVNQKIYRPLGNARLEVVDRVLQVTPNGPNSGLLITNPFPPPPPISEDNTPLAWYFALEFTPTFSDPDSGEMLMTSLGLGGKVIDITRYDNVTDRIYLTVGDRFGAGITHDVGRFMANRRNREERKYECTWLPPGWQRTGCTIVIIPPIVNWGFGVFGDAPLDSSLDDVFLEAIQLTSTEPFTVSLVDIQVGSEVDGVDPWTLSPSHVNVAGGEIVTLSGSGFLDIGDFTITVGEIEADNVVVVDDSTIRFEAPPNPSGLTEVVFLTDGSGLRAIFDNDFRYYDAAEPLLLDHGALSRATVNKPYAAMITAQGGTGSYSFKHASGNLPAGVVLNSDGSLVGTPTELGTFAFFVQVTDDGGNEDVRMFYFESLDPKPAGLLRQIR